MFVSGVVEAIDPDGSIASTTPLTKVKLSAQLRVFGQVGLVRTSRELKGWWWAKY